MKHDFSGGSHGKFPERQNDRKRWLFTSYRGKPAHGLGKWYTQTSGLVNFVPESR